ncbi:MAG: hypothetical protein HJJLKODD_02634 [Phycisphaerae bacterium]|nr:hypothetical protein [Phycisphaerae bacterium]
MILDRYILRSFVINYLMALSILLSVYVFLDLFLNFDEFVEDKTLTTMDILLGMGRYYGAQLFLYFNQISGVITLFALAFTLARMQRHNELVGVVASGVSLYRLAVPVIIAGMLLNGLWLLNQEWVIPRLGSQLVQSHEAAVREELSGVWFVRDQSGSMISALRFNRSAGQLDKVLIMRRDAQGRISEYIEADRATWIPTAHQDEQSWTLRRGAKLIRQLREDGTAEIERQPVDEFRTDLNPDTLALRQSMNWIQFVSRQQLVEIQKTGVTSTHLIARTIHNRFATPVVNMLILIIAIPFFLDRQPASVVQSGGKCLLVCGLGLLLAFFCQSYSLDQYPALMAWLPLMILTPVMVVNMDRLRT